MEARELYQHLLGLTVPWTVTNCELDVEAQEVIVSVDHPQRTKFCCSECDRELSVYDHAEVRRWRHLDSCQFKTVLEARVPRVKCPEHGVKQARVPWCEKHSRFTILFERFAIDVLLATQTVKGAMGILRLNWDATWHIVERAVKRGKTRKTERLIAKLGIDEKAFAKGHSYMTMLYDLERGTVEAISEGNDTAAALACYSELSEKQLAAIECVAMDMSSAYVKATKQAVPDGEEKIVHDRFHIMQMATKAVDKVRRVENKQLRQKGDDRLAGTRYLWLTSQENLTDKQRTRFDDGYKIELKTSKAWFYKELLRDLWSCETPEAATVYFKDWYKRVIHTKLKPMKDVATSLRSRLPNIVTYCVHEITNAVAEGMNSKIMSIKRRVGGYRYPENFKLAVLFHCGGLKLYP